ncbi:MAG: universal stress protein, partial [Nitriliruptoraceae bacterium]
GGAGDVAVETRVVAGTPARVLVAQAADADLLVVAARGLGGFRGLMLGSVSQQVVTHAPCPVVVVPPADERSRPAHDPRGGSP